MCYNGRFCLLACYKKPTKNNIKHLDKVGGLCVILGSLPQKTAGMDFAFLSVYRIPCHSSGLVILSLAIRQNNRSSDFPAK